jgi:hypothetical protein
MAVSVGVLLVGVRSVGAVVLEVRDSIFVPIRASGLGIGQGDSQKRTEGSPDGRSHRCTGRAVRVLDRSAGESAEESPS